MTAPDAAQLDVFLSGTVFLDLVFTGLRAPPAAGTEIFSAGLGSAPGGCANLAVALSRLGLGRHRRVVARRAGPAAGGGRVHAERGRGDELHPYRLGQGRARRSGPARAGPDPAVHDVVRARPTIG